MCTVLWAKSVAIETLQDGLMTGNFKVLGQSFPTVLTLGSGRPLVAHLFALCALLSRER